MRQHYVYDGWNRLVKVNNSSGSTVAINSYDAGNRQITVTESGSTTDLYYSNRWQVIEERASGGSTPATQYVWSPFYVDQMVERDAYSGGSSTWLYAEQDADFNVTSLINSSDGVAEKYAYDPYGTVTVLNASGGTLSGSAYSWLYFSQGLRLDAVSGLYSDRERPDKNPVLGRFDSEDPAGDINGPNECQDEESNPVANVDALGLDYATVTVEVVPVPDPNAEPSKDVLSEADKLIAQFDSDNPDTREDAVHALEGLVYKSPKLADYLEKKSDSLDAEGQNDIAVIRKATSNSYMLTKLKPVEDKKCPVPSPNSGKTVTLPLPDGRKLIPLDQNHKNTAIVTKNENSATFKPDPNGGNGVDVYQLSLPTPPENRNDPLPDIPPTSSLVIVQTNIVREPPEPGK